MFIPLIAVSLSLFAASVKGRPLRFGEPCPPGTVPVDPEAAPGAQECTRIIFEEGCQGIIGCRACAYFPRVSGEAGDPGAPALAAKCLLCAYGTLIETEGICYFQADGTPMPSNCAKTGRDAAFCQECVRDGTKEYALVDGLCEPLCLAGPSPVPNCRMCDREDTSACVLCEEGYYLEAGACVSCNGNQGEAGRGGGVAEPGEGGAAQKHCGSCGLETVVGENSVEVQALTCYSCMDGYFGSGDFCTADSGESGDSGDSGEAGDASAFGEAKGSGACNQACAACRDDDPSFCTRCPRGQGLAGSGETGECAPCPPGRSDCIFAGVQYSSPSVCHAMMESTPQPAAGLAASLVCRTVYTPPFCSQLSPEGICEKCLAGYFLDANKVCGKCASNCAECKDVNLCKEDGCAPGYRGNKYGSCDPCPSGCATCTEAKECQSCLPGFFASGGACKPCLPGCDSCEDEKTCAQCAAAFFPGQDGSCEACPKGCLRCSSAEECLLQEDGYYLDEGLPEPCPAGRVCSGETCDSAKDCDGCDPAGGLFREMQFNATTHVLEPAPGDSCVLRQENCLVHDYVERRNAYGILDEVALACSKCEDGTIAFDRVLGAVAANCTYPQALSAGEQQQRQVYLWVFTGILIALAVGLGPGIYCRERSLRGGAESGEAV